VNRLPLSAHRITETRYRASKGKVKERWDKLTDEDVNLIKPVVWAKL
jgi:hypothetical protein